MTETIATTGFGLFNRKDLEEDSEEKSTKKERAKDESADANVKPGIKGEDRVIQLRERGLGLVEVQHI
eukprot:4653817-Amphidinium_carterae.1